MNKISKINGRGIRDSFLPTLDRLHGEMLAQMGLLNYVLTIVPDGDESDRKIFLDLAITSVGKAVQTLKDMT